MQNTFLLVGCSQLQDITSFDISQCNNIDGTSVVDILPAMKNLSIFVYRNRKAISEYNLVRIADTCKSITYIDGTGGKEVSYLSALAVFCSLRNLTKIVVMPRNGESAHWGKLIMQFKNVVFAHCVKATLPYDGLKKLAFVKHCKSSEF